MFPRIFPLLQPLVTLVLTLAIAQNFSVPLAHGQSSPSTLSSKEKVSIILDREVVGSESFLLVKIMAPENAKVESFALSNPARIVVDFIGLKLKKSEDLAAPKNGIIKQFRLGAHADKLRVVMDLATPNAPAYEWKAGPRQALLRIAEGASAPAAVPATPVPVVAAPTSPPVATERPASTPTSPAAPTSPPPTKTSAPATPTTVPTATSTTPPTATPVATPLPRVAESAKTVTAPKLPEVVVEDSDEGTLDEDADEKAIAEALEKEVAAASQSLAQGGDLPEDIEVETDEGDVDVEVDEAEEESSPADEAPVEPTKSAAPALGAVAAAAGVGGKESAPSAPNTLTQALKPNVVPPTPSVSFMVEKANFEYLEPGHHQAFKLTLNQPGAQAQVSKIDGTTYKIAIASCGVSSLGLALPQYPPSDYTGLGMVSLKTDGDRVEITVNVQPGTTIMTFMREKEIWIKKQ